MNEAEDIRNEEDWDLLSETKGMIHGYEEGGNIA